MCVSGGGGNSACNHGYSPSHKPQKFKGGYTVYNTVVFFHMLLEHAAAFLKIYSIKVVKVRR